MHTLAYRSPNMRTAAAAAGHLLNTIRFAETLDRGPTSQSFLTNLLYVDVGDSRQLANNTIQDSKVSIQMRNLFVNELFSNNKIFGRKIRGKTAIAMTKLSLAT